VLIHDGRQISWPQTGKTIDALIFYSEGRQIAWYRLVMVRKDEYLSQLACPEWNAWLAGGGYAKIGVGGKGFCLVLADLRLPKGILASRRMKLIVAFSLVGSQRQELLCARLKFRLVAAHECTYKSIANYYDQLNPYDRK
jgi:hypothetical protein